jgi:subfamily B ATP-binding cassette protein MsbA
MIQLRRLFTDTTDPESAAEDATVRPEAASTGRLIWRFVRDMGGGWWRWLVLANIAMLVVAGATSATAWLMKPAVDQVAVGGDRSMMYVLAIILPMAFVLKGLASYVQRAAMMRASLGMIATARRRLFAHFLHQDLAFFQAHPAGTLTSRLIVDLELLKSTISGVSLTVGRDLTTLVGLVVTMVVMDWLMALVMLVVFPLMIGPIILFGRRARARSAALQETLGTYDAMLHQSFEGVRVIKVFSTPERERGRGRDLARRIFRGMVNVERVGIRLTLVVELATGLAVTGVILLGGSRVIGEVITPGTFFAFITALLLSYRPVKKLGRLHVQVQGGVAVLDRLFTLLDARPVLREVPGAEPLKLAAGAIRLEDVCVRHADASAPALDGLTLEVPAGKKVALVGPSGAGKSTVINLVARLLDPTSGRVLVDGQDLKTVQLGSLRRSLALVTQDVTLFEGSVLDNILFGAAEVPDPAHPSAQWRARAEAAARVAEAHEFIMALPEGYETSVGESGARLSGGQRQRIAIARAVMKDAPILLLDEATAALDRDTERRVQSALDRLVQGRTTLVVAHRLSTIRDADIIYVMDRGRVLARGDHASLMAEGGLYARLWETQGGMDPAPEASPVAPG